MLITIKGDWSDHLNKLKLALKNLRLNGIKYNIKELFFGQTDIEYLGFWVTRKGIQLGNKKVESIIKMMPPKNQKQVR